MSYKDSVATLKQDQSARIEQLYTAAKQQLSKVNTANLEGPARMEPSELTQALDNAYVHFTQQRQALQQTAAPLLKKAKQQRLYITLGSIAALLIFILISVKTSTTSLAFVGLVVCIVGLVVAGQVANGTIKGVAQEWSDLFSTTGAKIGYEESLHTQATGLFARVDDLYLRSLSSSERGFEMQRRQMQKQMDAQQEQHQEQVAMQKQLIEENRRLQKEIRYK